VISVTPNPFDFGTVTIGSSKQQPFTITNTGNATLTVNSVAFTSTEFSSTVQTPFDVPVAPNNTSKFSVRFAPTTTGSRPPGTMTITSNASPVSVTLTGAGVAPFPPAWSQYQGDARHTGRSLNTGPGPTKPSIVLSTPIGFSPSPPTVAGDGTVYVASGNSTTLNVDVQAFPLNGNPWTVSPGAFGQTVPSTAIAADGTVYFPLANRTDAFLFALNPGGSETWQFSLTPTDDLMSANHPARLTDGTVYVRTDYTHSNSGRIFAVKPDGTQRWVQTVSPPSGFCCGEEPVAIASDSTVYVPMNLYASSTAQANLVSLDAAGNPKWNSPLLFATASSSAPSVADDGTIYTSIQISAGSSVLAALNSIDGTAKWTAFTGTLNGLPPAIALDGTVYVGGDSGLEARNPTDGTLRWSFPTTAPMSVQTPALIDSTGHIFFAAGTNPFNPPVSGESAELIALNPDGILYWRPAATAFAVSLGPCSVTRRHALRCLHKERQPKFARRSSIRGVFDILHQYALLEASSFPTPRRVYWGP